MEYFEIEKENIKGNINKNKNKKKNKNNIIKYLIINLIILKKTSQTIKNCKKDKIIILMKINII